MLLVGGVSSAEENLHGSDAAHFTEFTVEAFFKQKVVREKIDLTRVDRALLDAAVFHETNRRRRQHGLPTLVFDHRAREAARMQVRAMAEHDFIGHENPFDADLRTPMDRAKRAGLEPAFLAENLANAFARQYQGGEKAYVRVEGGEQIVSAAAGGPRIPMRSYREFAQALLDDWMGSPGHRKNILHQSPEYLGSACTTALQDAPMEKLSCAQVFFTPRARP